MFFRSSSSSDCSGLPKMEDAGEVVWKSGGTSCDPRESKTLSSRVARCLRISSHSCGVRHEFNYGYSDMQTHQSLSIKLIPLLFDDLGDSRSKLSRHVSISSRPTQRLRDHTLSCSRTASVIHRTLAFSARTSTAV